ncbi:MAG: response regulator [Bacteroidota bacterium]
MKTHIGRKLEFIAAKLGYSAYDLSVLLNISQSLINKLFDTKDLSLEIINSIGKAINYNLESHFPELYHVNYKPLVYIVDDEDLDIHILKRWINKISCDTRVEVFKNGDDAISKLLNNTINSQEIPDYIFLDLTMPVCNGWDFVLNFERLDLDPLKMIRIFILTSSLWKEDFERARIIPIVENVIPKPITLDMVRSIFNIQTI